MFSTIDREQYADGYRVGLHMHTTGIDLSQKYPPSDSLWATRDTFTLGIVAGYRDAQAAGRLSNGITKAVWGQSHAR